MSASLCPNGIMASVYLLHHQKKTFGIQFVHPSEVWYKKLLLCTQAYTLNSLKVQNGGLSLSKSTTTLGMLLTSIGMRCVDIIQVEGSMQICWERVRIWYLQVDAVRITLHADHRAILTRLTRPTIMSTHLTIT